MPITDGGIIPYLMLRFKNNKCDRKIKYNDFSFACERFGCESTVMQNSYDKAAQSYDRAADPIYKSLLPEGADTSRVRVDTCDVHRCYAVAIGCGIGEKQLIAF